MRDRLAAEIEKARARWLGQPMSFDGCLMDLAEIYRAALGIDPAWHWRGVYSDADEMVSSLGRFGIPGAVARAARRANWPRIDPSDAETGDLGLLMMPSGFGGVIHAGAGKWLGRMEDGWTCWPTEMGGYRIIRAAWSVC